jgi:hypothetical protein
MIYFSVGTAGYNLGHAQTIPVKPVDNSFCLTNATGPLSRTDQTFLWSFTKILVIIHFDLAIE